METKFIERNISWLSLSELLVPLFDIDLGAEIKNILDIRLANNVKAY